jgi:TIGR00252 family protein
MISTRDKGNFGETAAVDYLMKAGYTIKDRNFRSRYGEIDIIGEDDGCIAFIEVKSRQNINSGMPCEAVGYKKQKQIVNMALMYIAKNNLIDSNFRFDVVEIIFHDSDVEYINLIKDAFRADYGFY